MLEYGTLHVDVIKLGYWGVFYAERERERDKHSGRRRARDKETNRQRERG